MKKFYLLLLLLVPFSQFAAAAPGDTTWIQTFTFDMGSKSREGTFTFPDGSVKYEKILMYYTLKCDPAKNPACGEWDYDVYTKLLKQVGTNPETGAPVYDVWRLGVYVTPYGINLDMGNGWTWVYDVTDYQQLLRGETLIQDGNGQELLDLKFAFIEGEPARDFVSIRKVYDSSGVGYSGYWEGYPLSIFDQIVRDTTLTLTAQEKQVKLRTTLTGHMYGSGNNCAEFCNNIHSLKVNGNVIKSWNIIKPCAINPLYPQGGTWIYDRAGWCPGEAGIINEFELTDYVKNSSINFDYDVQADANGVYRTLIELVTYGEIKQSDDAAAEMIISPTNDMLQSRFNPSCGKPVVVIKNIGSNPLTSATINYGIEGGKKYTFFWEGNLKFAEKDTVALPLPDYNEATGTTSTFFFEIISPNGKDDPTAFNNKMYSEFALPKIINRNAVNYLFKTNNRPTETSWKLEDTDGNVIEQGYGYTEPNTQFTYDWDLPDGSYKLSLYDTADDGLYYWQYGTKGAAQLRYKVTATLYNSLHSFEPEFGRYAYFSFAVNKFTSPNSDISTATSKEFTIFPSPAEEFICLDLTNVYGRKLSAEIYNTAGKKVQSAGVAQMNLPKLDVKDLAAGVYTVQIVDGGKTIASGKFIKN